MKKFANMQRPILCLICVMSVLISCKKSNIEDGFSQEIRNFVPDSTMQKLKDLGMVINEGKTPPEIEGIFSTSPMILLNSSVPDEAYSTGYRFIDYVYEFYNQNNQKLTLSLNEIGYNAYGSKITESNGNGAFISGKGDDFSAFIILEGYKILNSKDSAFCRTLEVISGTITKDGIENFQTAIWMLDNYNDPYHVFIPNNSGRIINDGDFISERMNDLKSDKIQQEHTLITPLDK